MLLLWALHGERLETCGRRIRRRLPAVDARREQLLVADITYDLDDNKALTAAKRTPWLFEELSEEMMKAIRK